MCGICGFVGVAGADTLRQMRDVLVHRGPDDSGEFFEEPVALGHRRLSIVDRLSGQQPLHSADGSVVVVFNGEIYNHPQLKSELQQRGHVYRTNSDTESIANAYLEYGDECLNHLDGMFAFVLYDRARGRVLGARDRFGKKPFFYGQPSENGGRSFVFGSEIRSLLRHPGIRRDAQISEAGVYQYLLHDHLPGRQTMFRNIWKLEAGHALSIDSIGNDPQLRVWEYWRNAILDAPNLDITEEEASEQVVQLLEQAVKRRLMGDVPLGVFLSGGLDSSALTALLSKSVLPRDIKTFSIGFEERSFDESAFAETVSRHLGTTHQSRVFSAKDCLAELSRVTDHMDEPFADPSMLPMSLLCRFARETVTVALGGDGGDELFAGYDPFRALAPARIYDAMVPHTLDRWVFRRLARFLPASERNMAWSFKVQRFLRGAKVAPALRLSTWLGAFSVEQLGLMLSATSDRGEGLEPEAALFEQVSRSGGGEIQAALAYFQRFYLTDDILVKADRASMMHSLEVRAPFLDTALAQFVNRLPSALKFRGGSGKVLLKRAFSPVAGRAGMLPAEIVGRAKKGFGIPVARWIRRELRGEFHEKLIDAWPSALAMIDKKQIARLLNAHVAGQENNYKEIWALYMLGEWARRWAA